MSVFERPNGSVLVQEYDLHSFLQSVVTLANDGYVLGETNEDYPQGYVGSYSVGMVKQETTKGATSISSDSSGVVDEVVEQPKPASKMATASTKRQTKASTAATN